MISAKLQRFRYSFQYRLFLVFTVLSALISALLGAFYVSYEIREGREHASSQLQQMAQQMAFSIQLPLYAENLPVLKQHITQMATDPKIHSISIFSANGALLADSRRTPLKDKPDTMTVTVDVFSNSMSSPADSALPGSSNASSPRIGSLRMERYTTDLKESARNMVLTAIFAALSFWLGVSAVCHLVLRRVTASFNELMKGIQSIQKGDYSRRINIDSDDEPGMAAREINRLAELLLNRDAQNSRLQQELLEANSSLQAEIVERSRAEQVIRESERSLKNLLNVMPVGIAWSSRDGHIDYLNKFFLERFGYSADEIGSCDDWFLLAYPDQLYRAEMTQKWQQALAVLQNTRDSLPMFESKITSRDGKVRHLITKLAVSGNSTVMILIDITEREMMQEQLVKAQKLESIGILAGGIAHNFNNALTGVLGFISLAIKQIDQSHKAWPLLQHAETATKRATGIAKQLLTFARGGAPFKKPVSIRKLVEESILLTLNGTNVRADVSIPDTLHSVMADEDQLNQVFSNIIINALQAMPKGGQLSISAENVKLSGNLALTAQNCSHVRLTFTDQGHGIPSEELEHIFDPYYTTKPSNSGLGLASVYSIISKHGGQILVDSAVDQGTTFTIILPATGLPAVQCETGQNQAFPVSSNAGSILIMDDEEVILNVAKETFSYLGYTVTTCTDGANTLEKYRTSMMSGAPYMAVILDLTIPGGMGGVETAREILAIHPEAKLLVSSGYSLDPVMADYRKYGFCDAIAKPYRADEIASKLSFLSAN